MQEGEPEGVRDTMRHHAAEARPSRTEARASRSLAALFEEALTVIRQDLSEYGYIGLCGAFSAAILATVLRYIDTPVSNALIVPALAAVAVGALATCAAALERTQDGLQPDSGRSFAEALVRMPWLFARVLPAVLPLSAAVYITDAYGGDVGTWPMLGINAALVLTAVYAALPVAIYVAALFSRDATPAQASAHALAIMHNARSIVVTSLLVALAPAEAATAIALLSGFGTMTTALFAFAAIICMPLAAAMMSLIHAEIAPWINVAPAQMPAHARTAAPSASTLASRLDRHIR
jgi:hypothetical protein